MSEQKTVGGVDAAISTEELKQQLIQGAYQKKGNAEINSLYTGPTEVIDLPSKGLVYPKDSLLSSGQITMKYMTAKEEDILTSDALLRDGTMIDKLIRSLVVDPIDTDDLIVQDKDWLMIAARVMGYGAEYKFTMKDPFSGKDQEVSIDLSKIEFKEIDEDLFQNQNQFQYTFPKCKKTITFQLMTGKKQKENEANLKKEKYKKNAVDNTLSENYSSIILNFDGETDRNKIKQMYRELIALDSRDFRNYIKKIAPGAILKFWFVSDETGGEREMDIPFGKEFLYGTGEW